MESILINPKTKDEAKLIKELLQKMNISSKIITEEEKEEIGLLMMMEETDRSELVPFEEVLKKLKS